EAVLLCRNPVTCLVVGTSNLVYEYQTHHDQIAVGRGPRSPDHGAGGPAASLVQVLPQGLHPAPAVRPADLARVPQDRLPGAGAIPAGLARPAPDAGPIQGSRPLHPPEGGHPPSGKKGVAALFDAAVARARQQGLIGPKPRGVIDATGYETRHASRYYV